MGLGWGYLCELVRIYSPRDRRVNWLFLSGIPFMVIGGPCMLIFMLLHLSSPYAMWREVGTIVERLERDLEEFDKDNSDEEEDS